METVMSANFRLVGLCILTSCLAACFRGVLIPKVDAPKISTQNIQIPTPDLSALEDSHDYSMKANLKLATTDAPLPTANSNSVTLEGTGLRSNYTIRYKFNSGHHTSLEILASKLTLLSSADCPTPTPLLTLEGPKKSQLIWAENQISVKPDTNYTLEMGIAHFCKSLKVTYDIVAWIGDASEDPHYGWQCSNSLGLPAEFFPTQNIITAFSLTKPD